MKVFYSKINTIPFLLFLYYYISFWVTKKLKKFFNKLKKRMSYHPPNFINYLFRLRLTKYEAIPKIPIPLDKPTTGAIKEPAFAPVLIASFLISAFLAL